ncbi:FAD-binding oxidoreductase [Pedobacter yonginense]|uniref:D-lactate dehydrogenase (cytochrome) n=1 Tax=Pedobacter yonginense TaxID=651869 RepID=A0A317EMY7_9SPHI|nr:FAD-binding oxidoreductase [Pedobacter yonginense]PWS28181.1 FAD-binding oxidoreductase [Pedobacter yonginense]
MIVKENKEEFYQYTTDQANLSGACDKVFIVKNSQEVREVVLTANKCNTPLTVCGNHTSLTGSSLPSSGWVLSTEELNEIIEINEQELFAIVEPGVTLKSLQQALAPLGLFFPPDPTEDSCFIGGMIGTNASGARSFGFGPTRDSILELDFILAAGEEISFSRSENIQEDNFCIITKADNIIQFNIPQSYVLPDVKNAAGYFLKSGMSPIDLFIGAEGTLGVITKAKLKLKKRSLDYVSLVVFFQDLSDCFTCIDLIRQSSNNFQLKNINGIAADAIEFFDKNSLNLLRDKFTDIPKTATAAVWIEYGVNANQSYEDILNQWESFFISQEIDTSFIWFGADSNDRAKIKNMRHSLPVTVNEIIKKRGLRKLGTDVAVPFHLFEDFYRMATQATEAKGLQYVAFGHFGNSHLHLNILPANEVEMQAGKALYSKLCTDAIALGGTFSAEHGVGKLKCNYLKQMIGEENFAFMKKVKEIFDPKNILGRGTLFKLNDLN